MGWNGKGLSDRCTGFGWQYLVRIRGFLAKMRLVRKQMLEENGRRSRGPMLRAALENMVGDLKVGEWVSREAIGPRQRRGLVTLYGLLRGGHERMSKGRDIVRMTRSNGKSSRCKTSIINERSRGVDGGATENGAVRVEGRCFNFLLTV